MFLGLRHERLQRALQRRVPQAVVDQLAPALIGHPLEPAQFALQRDVLELGVRGDQRHRARGLVDFPALDAHQPVLDHVEPADALLPGAPVEFHDRFQNADRLAVDRHRHATLEPDDDLVGRAPVERRVLGVVVDVLGGGVPQVLEEAGLDRAAPHVLVDRERRALGDVDRDGVLLGERNGLLARPRVVPDRGQHLQIRCQRSESDLEADLVVALAGAAVCDDAAAVLAGRGHQVLDDQRAADRRHQRVAVHVERVGLDGRQAVLVGELVAGIDHHRFDRTAVHGTLPHDLHVLAALAEVDGDGDDLAAGLLADPADGHRGVQTAGIRQDDAIGHETDLLVLGLLPVQRFSKVDASSRRSSARAPPPGRCRRRRSCPPRTAAPRGRWSWPDSGRHRAGCAAPPGCRWRRSTPTVRRAGVTSARCRR